MAANVKPELILATLSAQGVAGDPGRAQAQAALSTALLDGAAAAFAQIPLEQEPAAYVAELRRGAP